MGHATRAPQHHKLTAPHHSANHAARTHATHNRYPCTRNHSTASQYQPHRTQTCHTTRAPHHYNSKDYITAPPTSHDHVPHSTSTPPHKTKHYITISITSHEHTPHNRNIPAPKTTAPQQSTTHMARASDAQHKHSSAKKPQSYITIPATSPQKILKTCFNDTLVAKDPEQQGLMRYLEVNNLGSNNLGIYNLEPIVWGPTIWKPKVWESTISGHQF